VLDETGRSVVLHDTFERYQLVKSVLRGQNSAQTLRDRAELQRRVREALDVSAPGIEEADPVDETPESPAEEKTARWSIRAGAGIAAAALLAVATFWLARGNVEPEPAPTQIVALPRVTETPVADAVGTALPARMDRVMVADDRIAARHTDYLEKHARWAARGIPDAAVAQ
jgi:negative regulator of sigma E activity